MPPNAWNDRSDRDLLLTIIESGNVDKIDWHAIAANLNPKGSYTFTHEACRQHFFKIRRDSRNASASNGTPVSTPVKGKDKNTPLTNGKISASKVAAEGDDEEDLNLQTPTNKRKRSASVKRKRSASVKRKRSASVKKQKTKGEDLGGFEGQTAMQFKVEERDEEGNLMPYDVDVDDEDIYV